MNKKKFLKVITELKKDSDSVWKIVANSKNYFEI